MDLIQNYIPIKILNKKICNKIFKIQWALFGKKESTWEPIKNLPDWFIKDNLK